VLVERRREKSPDLRHDHRRGEDYSQHQRGGEENLEGCPRRGIDQVFAVQQRKDRTLEQADYVELREKGERRADSDDYRARHPEETPAQLLQMIQEGHLVARSFFHTARVVLPKRL
jgi:hypothetical protein